MNQDFNIQNPDSNSLTHTVRLRERLRGETHAAILSAAESVLAEQGLEARIGDVAARAGVAVGTLYNHFGDREGVLRAVLESNRDELFAALDAIAERPSPEFVKNLERFVLAILDHWERHAAFFTVVMQEGRGERPGICRRAEIAAALRLRAQALLVHGFTHGLLRPDLADLHADLLLGAVHAVVLRRILHAAPMAEAKVVVAFFLRGAGVDALRTTT